MLTINRERRKNREKVAFWTYKIIGSRWPAFKNNTHANYRMHAHRQTRKYTTHARTHPPTNPRTYTSTQA